MKKVLTTAALALATSSIALSAVPAHAQSYRGESYSQYERNGYNTGYSAHGNGYSRGYDGYGYGEPVYDNTRVWRGRDGNYYFRKHDGTTGLIVGAAAGALLGNSVAGYRDRGLGTIVGGAIGALLGKHIAQSSRCD